ncbi:MAG: TorF family putative porin [Hyphomicrobiales bacterium]|nr:TorF family putative porin [Hyphomicrobiales bacterium]
MRILTAAAALLMSASAYAADLPTKKAPDAPPPEKPLIAWPTPNFDVFGSGFDYAFGAKLQSDDMFRGVSQTGHRPSGTAYGELHYGWLYAGVQPWNVKLPTQPLMELDLYGGIRPTWGPLTLDFGALYYKYPSNKTQYYLGGTPAVATFFTIGGIPTTARDPSFLELYAKGTWAINDYLTIGANTNYDPNWNNYGAKGLYSEINAKITFGETGFSTSGAFGHYYLGRSSWLYGYSYVDPSQFYTGYARGFKFASYNSWNVGVSYNYKVATFDLRYYGSSLGKSGCAINTSDPAANYAASIAGVGKSSWCGNAIVGSISVDFTSASFK